MPSRQCSHNKSNKESQRSCSASKREMSQKPLSKSIDSSKKRISDLRSLRKKRSKGQMTKLKRYQPAIKLIERLSSALKIVVTMIQDLIDQIAQNRCRAPCRKRRGPKITTIRNRQTMIGSNGLRQNVRLSLKTTVSTLKPGSDCLRSGQSKRITWMMQLNCLNLSRNWTITS